MSGFDVVFTVTLGLSLPGLISAGVIFEVIFSYPGLGRLMYEAVMARDFPVIAGSARRENTTVFVSRGVGTVWIPVRVNCPPEVALLTLEPVVPA